MLMFHKETRDKFSNLQSHNPQLQDRSTRIPKHHVCEGYQDLFQASFNDIRHPILGRHPEIVQSCISIRLVLHYPDRLDVSLTTRNTPYPTNRVHRERWIPRNKKPTPRIISKYSSLSLDCLYDLVSHTEPQRPSTKRQRQCIKDRHTYLQSTAKVLLFSQRKRVVKPLVAYPSETFPTQGFLTPNSLFTHIYDPDLAVKSYSSSP